MTPQEIVDTINNPKISDDTIFYLLKEYFDKDELGNAQLCIQNNFNCSQDIAKETLVLYKEQIYDKIKKAMADAVASLTPEQIAQANAAARESLNKPKCPTCQSTNLKKISVTSKVMNTAIFGLFGAKRYKTFHCNNCGYEW